MTIDELFESADKDVQESVWAQSVLTALFDRVQNGVPGKFKPTVMVLQTGDDALDALIAHLTIKFQRGLGGGEFRPGPNGFGGTIICFMRDEIDQHNVLRYLTSRVGASTFRHEFQHFLDHNSGEKIPQRGSYDSDQMHDADQYRAYLNSDMEFNAYMKELAEPLLAILRAAQWGDAETVNNARIEPDFRKYVRGQHFLDSVNLWNVLTHMNDGYRVRMLKRLAALHKAVVALAGVQPYSPGKRDRVIMWLGKTLKSLGVGKNKPWGKRN